jgi:K(+)-stimulated pyrophosphate-energized sodium pump
MLPFVFSALSMNAVGRAAMAMIEEVRRQFRDIPALKAALEVMRKNDSDMSKASAADRKIFDAADGVAEYDKCVEISTQASIREMVLPGLLAIIVPVLIGFIGGAEMLGGLLAGVTTCGVLMAIFQSNAGGAWDNAKKMIEEQGKKGTEAHKAAVVGDTVGDPFKDTSGPSLNILLKLMSVVALVIAPSIAMNNSDVVGSSSSSSNEIVMGENRLVEGEIVVYNSNERNVLKIKSSLEMEGQDLVSVSFKGKYSNQENVTFESPVFNSQYISFASKEVKPVNGNSFVAYGDLKADDMTYTASFDFQVDNVINGVVSFKE